MVVATASMLLSEDASKCGDPMAVVFFRSTQARTTLVDGVFDAILLSVYTLPRTSAQHDSHSVVSVFAAASRFRARRKIHRAECFLDVS